MDAKSLEAGYSNNFLLRKFKGYYELMKPRVMSLVIFTAFVGMFLAPGQITFLNSFLVIIAIVLSFLFSYITVKFFLNYLNKFSLNIFVIYRLIIALILLSIIYF